MSRKSLVLPALLLVIAVGGMAYGLKQRAATLAFRDELAERRRMAWKIESLWEDLWRADRMGRAGALVDTHELAAAIARAGRELLKTGPRQEEVLTLVGRAHEMRNDLDAAEKAYSEACDLVDPAGQYSTASLRRGLLRLRMLARRSLLEPVERDPLRDLANTDLRRAVNRMPDFIQRSVPLAAMQACSDDPAGAIRSCDVILEADATDAWTTWVRGVVRTWGKKDAGALADFDAAIRINPHPPEPYAFRGAGLVRMGRRDEGAASLGQAVKRDPVFFEALHLLGILLQEDRKLPEAFEHFKACAALQPDHLGSVRHAFECDPAGALPLATAYIGAKRDDPAGWLIRARIHIAMKNLESAAADAATFNTPESRALQEEIRALLR